MSVLLYAFRFVKEHKWKRYILLCVILFFIQKTAILGIAIYPFYHLCMTADRQSRILAGLNISYKQQITKVMLIIGNCLIIVFVNNMILWIVEITGAFQAQENYLQGDHIFVWRILIYMSPVLFLMLLYKRGIVKKNPDFEFLRYL